MAAATDQDKLYAATAEGLDAVEALVRDEGWDSERSARVAHAVRVRIIDELNTEALATTELAIEPAPMLWRLDTLRRAGLSPAI
jgi:hypothetical protein